MKRQKIEQHLWMIAIYDCGKRVNNKCIKFLTEELPYGPKDHRELKAFKDLPKIERVGGLPAIISKEMAAEIIERVIRLPDDKKREILRTTAFAVLLDKQNFAEMLYEMLARLYRSAGIEHGNSEPVPVVTKGFLSRDGTSLEEE